MIAAITAEGWALIIGAVFLGITNVLTLVFQHRAHVVSGKIHMLVNSAMEAQLLLNRNTTARLAELSKEPDDIANADIAAKAWSVHHAKQLEMDQKDE